FRGTDHVVWSGEEERDHDDRLRAGSSKSGWQEPGGCDLQRLPAALPSDHDDHGRGAVWNPSDRARIRRRRRCATAARTGGGGRTGGVAVVDSVYHAGDLSVHGKIPALASRRRGAAEAAGSPRMKAGEPAPAKRTLRATRPVRSRSAFSS